MTGLDPNRWGAAQSDAAIAERRALAVPDGWAEPTSHLELALVTATIVPVFPCLPSKRPATEHGFHDATSNHDRIRSWWQRYPDHLVGIPTTGLVVVDLDERPDRVSGWDSWITVAEPHGWTVTDPDGYVAVLMAATPSGGVHIYHQTPPNAEVRNSAGKLGPCLDVRADGGYVIVPGSHLPDGRRYELLHPFPTRVPVAPSWLIDLCARPVAERAVGPTRLRPSGAGGTRYGLRALETELGRLATAREGTRNDTLVRAAYRIGQLVAGGEITPHHAHDELLVVAIRNGLDQQEAERTIASGLRSGAQVPRAAS